MRSACTAASLPGNVMGRVISSIMVRVPAEKTTVDVGMGLCFQKKDMVCLCMYVCICVCMCFQKKDMVCVCVCVCVCMYGNVMGRVISSIMVRVPAEKTTVDVGMGLCFQKKDAYMYV